MPRNRNLFLLTAIFVFAGAMHFFVPRSYLAIMPPWVPLPLEAVYLSGVLEILGGLALLVSPIRRAAGLALIALLIAVFPANIQMLMNAVASAASPLHVTLLWLRLPLQPLLIVWVYRAAFTGAICRGTAPRAVARSRIS